MAESTDITFILGRLEGKVDSLLAISRQQSEELQRHDGRIRRLEHYRAYLLGTTVSIATAASFIIHLIGK